MKSKILAIFFCCFLFKANSQTMETISTRICDSIHTLKIENEDSLFMSHINIFTSELSKNSTALLDLNRKNVKNQINVINYKLTRELNRNCPDFKIKGSKILTFTSILDIENLFSQDQTDSITKAVKDFRKKNEIELLFVTIDDLYPYRDFNEYAMNQANHWQIGSVSAKGGILVVFSKSLRGVRISTSNSTQKLLTDSECSEIIEKTMIPEFKKGNFYKAVLDCIIEINNKL